MDFIQIPIAQTNNEIPTSPKKNINVIPVSYRSVDPLIYFSMIYQAIGNIISKDIIGIQIFVHNDRFFKVIYANN